MLNRALLVIVATGKNTRKWKINAGCNENLHIGTKEVQFSSSSICREINVIL